MDDDKKPNKKKRINTRVTKREVTSQHNALASIVSEFLGSYILLGYNLEGEPLAIQFSTNQLEADALETLLSRYIIYRNNIPPGLVDE